MRARQSVPRLWLMTDERLGDGLWTALARLPRGAGVVFRHYALPARERRRLFAMVLRVARRRGLVLVRAGRVPLRGEMGVHNGRGRGLSTRSVHSRRELGAARGADAIFVSPIFATRSHPGRRGLGAVRAGLLLGRRHPRAIALGGMTVEKFRQLNGLGFYGWAAIDAWASAPKAGAAPRIRT